VIQWMDEIARVAMERLVKDVSITPVDEDR
jgi:hypothetical protein